MAPISPTRSARRVSSGCIRLRNEDIEALVAEVNNDQTNASQGIPVQVFP